ncbi:MAG: glucose-6-phosphate dehydrogenase assembly protein OpcA [Nesterenkonia sp.]|nr:glucose-6-phosphate dehydrogenase assembly protein OpcA [Nesterenkonia sp.]
MIVDVEHTTTAEVGKRLAAIREDGGVVALSRVLTLVILASDDRVEEAIDAANLASREHPCRIIVLAVGAPTDETRLDAQIRVGGDAGASEVVILRCAGELVEHQESTISSLLLPDAPVVAWWADEVPSDVSATPIGRLAHRRITDVTQTDEPYEALEALRAAYTAGDTDLSWTRLTRWRIQLASILDAVDPATITSVTVDSPAEVPSAALLAAWLHRCLQVPIGLTCNEPGTVLTAVHLHTTEGDVVLSRPEGDVAHLHPAQGPTQSVPLPVRTLEECLAEELRRLDADEVFGEVLTEGLADVDFTACVLRS